MSDFNTKELQDTVQGLRAISHELRLAILCHLAERPMSVSEIINMTGAGQSNISQHLAKMRLMGLIKKERHGKQIYYQIADPKFTKIIEALKAVYCSEVRNV